MLGSRLSWVVVLVVASLGALAGGGAAQVAPPTCFGQRATVVGTGGGDKMQGTSGPDVMVGQGGNDTMDGGGGDDLICGNAQNDNIHGGVGNDRIDGGDDSDVVAGDNGNDTVDGGAGDDADVLSGGPGDDAIVGKHQGDSVTDQVDYRASATGVQVDLAAGRATGEGTDTLTGVDRAVGSNGGDVITGNNADNVLDGAGGNDRVDGGPGADRLSGDAGDDSIVGGPNPGNGVLTQDYAVYSAAPTGVQVDLAAGRATGWGTDTLSGVEGVMGSQFNDVIAGGPGDNLLLGQDGDDELRGQDGTDFALFRKPVDADLGRGTATGEGTDKLVGLVGLIGSSGNDRLTGDDKRNVLSGGPGNDVLSGAGGPDDLIAVGATTMDGGAGADQLEGGPNPDKLDGGPGDDMLFGRGGDDTIDGGAGVEDIVNYLAAGPMRIDLEQGTATGEGTDRLVNVEGVSGSTKDDEIVGDAKANSLAGGDGNDRVSGGAGPDFLDGGVGQNALDGGPGQDYCRQRGLRCESSGSPNIPGKPPLPPGVTPPPAVAVLGALSPARVQRGETAAYKYAAEPVCIAVKPYATEIAPPRTVLPIAGDGRPEEAWWQGTLYRGDPKRKGRYKKFKTTPWARADLAGGAVVPGVTLWKEQTGKQPFANTVRLKVKRGRYVWKGNLYWVRSGGQVFEPIEPHIIRARTIRHNKQCVFP